MAVHREHMVCEQLMNQPNLVTTLVVNWNGRAHLDRCFASLLAQTYQPQEIILVDNGSTDGSADHVQAHYPAVQVIRLPHNTGFAAGNNVGMRRAAGEYIAVLNNDAYAEPNWLAAMVHAAESDSCVGMVACKILFADAPDMINSAGLALDWAGFCWDWRGGQPDDLQVTPQECFGPSGAAALYRRAMLDDVGLYDEDFFAYAEDADLDWRAQRAGWRAVYVPTARVYHAASATLGEGSRLKQFLLGRNKVWMFAKNMPGGRYLAWIALLLVYDLIAVGYGLLARGDVGALEGRLAGWWGLPRMLRKRRQLKTRTNDYLRLIHPAESLGKISARFRHIQGRTRARLAASPK
jgi:GT2 family glycosyltransferase